MPNPPIDATQAAEGLLPELFTMLQPHMKELDTYLAQQLESFEPEIRKYVDYCIDTSGKRIRPSLIFFSGWQDDGSVSKDLVKLGAVVETVHLATLVHDDIMDEADMRRNRATVAKAYGNHTAVLLGDALFSHAVYLSTLFPTNEVCRKVAESTRKVCTGEILQTMQRGDPDIDLDTYFRVIDLKTAELFYVACYLGAKLTSQDPARVEAAGIFGRQLGIAYQIYDDLTDLFGTQEKIGKTLGTDIATGKATLPLIMMRERLPDEEAATLRDTLAGKCAADIPYWLGRLRELGIFEEVKERIFATVDTADAALAPYAERKSTQFLLSLSRLLRNQVDALKSE